MTCERTVRTGARGHPAGARGKLRPRAWLAVVALAATALVGCGDDGSSGGPGGPEDDPAPAPEPAPPPPGALQGRSVGELLVPFDADRQDLVGPADHQTLYGRRPSIIARPDGALIDVLAQDYDEGISPRAVLLHLAPGDEGYEVAWALEVPILDRLMGFARDEDGAFYVASGIDEGDDLTPEYPAEDQYRENIVRVVKLDAEGEVAFDTDLDTARAMAAENPEQVINPMVAATARLAVGGGTAALVHGINTEPDPEIDGQRHQKALTTHLDATTGAVTRTSSIWVSHSFDQRLLYDGRGFIEMHLGDAFPRYIALARVAPSSGRYPLFFNKGARGNNNTFTRLGAIALIEDDPSYGYLANFATERSTGTDPLYDSESQVAGIRDLAVVRVLRNFEGQPDDAGLDHLDPDLPDTLTVEAGDHGQQTNRLRWLTDYGSLEETTHAARPKLVAIGEDRFIALWETWERTGSGRDAYTFTGTHGMLLDAEGAPLEGATELTDHHLPRGDDAFAVNGEAAWITGDRELQVLRLHLVDDTLAYRQIVVE